MNKNRLVYLTKQQNWYVTIKKKSNKNEGKTPNNCLKENPLC